MRGDIILIVTLAALVGIAVFVAELGQLSLAGRLGYFTAGLAIAFTAVRFRKRRK